ncbi:MAG: hypothetical protein ACI837_003351 [Crocinitomicaceae bacterium]|jgi:hypothetical protein
MTARAEKTHKNTVSDEKQDSQSILTDDSVTKNTNGSSLQFVDNRTESAAQLKLQEKANTSAKISRLSTLQKMANIQDSQRGKPIQKKEIKAGSIDSLSSVQSMAQTNSAPIQLARIPVGFNSVSVALDPVADSLVTAGLGNCIAVACQDLTTGRAVMGHLDTGTIINNLGAFQAFRTLLENELTRAAGGAINPRFQVSIGRVWMSENRDVNAAVNAGWWNMRDTLLMNCINAFGTEPTEAGAVAEFNLGQGRIHGSGSLGEEVARVAPPADDPNGRAGDDIPYDRLRRGNARGHKLDKNMNLLDRASVRMNPD